MRRLNLIHPMTAVILASVLIFTGCGGDSSATAEDPAGTEVKEEQAAEKPSEDNETSQASEEAAPSEEEETPSEAPASDDTGADKKSMDSSPLPEYIVDHSSYETDYDHFYGDFDSVKITDDGHETLKNALEKYFEEKRTDFDKACADSIEEAKSLNKDVVPSEDGYSDYYNYSYSISCEVTRADNALFSIMVSESTYTGGAHGGTYVYGLNFDSKTGEKLENDAFGDIAPSVKDYIVSSIAASGKDTEEMLFPDYRDTLDEMFKSGMKDKSFWFDNNRLCFSFQEYDIAPYAAGILTFNVPYPELDGFNSSYLPDNDFTYIVLNDNGIADSIDIDGNGKGEKVYLETVNNDDSYCDFILHIDDSSKKLEGDGYYYYGELSFYSGSEGSFFFLKTTSDNDWNDTLMYDAENLNLIASQDGAIRSVSAGKAVINSREYVLGTWGVDKDYSFDSKGFTLLDDTGRLNNGADRDNPAGLTLLKDLNYHKEPGEAGNKEYLEKGTVIYPTSISPEEMGFETKDGKTGYFRYEYDDEKGGIFVDGVNEYELFDGIMYAG